MVADYPIRLFLLALAAWSVPADVCAQSPVTVGYYDMTVADPTGLPGAGHPTQELPIIAAGFAPRLLTNVSAPDLAGLQILFVQNPSPSAYNTEYLNSRPAISDAVNAGMILVIHDRLVLNQMAPMTNARNILPGSSVTTPPTSKGNPMLANQIEVSDTTTLVANGPFGPITNTNLDNGQFSNSGFVNVSILPVLMSDRRALLHTGTGALQSQSVAFSYKFGQGYVIYSTIPLDMFLKDMGTATPAVKSTFRDVYAPNVLTYAACGLKAFPATVGAGSATGHYGGTTTLTATVKCGVIPVVNANVTFTLNGIAVGQASTNADGIATLINARLGSLPASPATAIPAGSYPAGVVAAFAGTGLYGASTGTAALTVQKAPASISVTGGTFVYDAAPHAATGTVTGVFGESLGVPTFTYNDEHDVTSDVAPVNTGTYRITASVAETANYLATSDGSSAQITITRASLIVAAHDKTKPYGAAVPELTAAYKGFVGDENASVLSGTLQVTTNATAASAVGEYSITPAGVASSNYDIAFVVGTLTVSPAPLTVRADDKTKVYGAALPVFTARYEGLVLGETPGVLSGALALQTNATVRSHVGRYDVTPSGLTSRNYSITFAPGDLMVTPAPLKIHADDKERLVGKLNPVLTVTYDGFVLDETEAVLDVRPSVATTATVSSPVGDYPIVAAGAGDSNYTIDYLNGDLTVSPEGRVHGSGFVDAEGVRHHFVFDARETIVLGEKGSLSLRVERLTGSDVFVSQVVTSVVFADNSGVAPGGKAVVDGVAVAGLGTWNGVAATFELLALDMGEPGVGSDTITIRVKVAGQVVNTTQGALNGGNVQSNRVK
jgi:hypothetical protein